VTHFYLGLDLGQASDYTALAVLQKLEETAEPHQLRHLQRFALGTPYTDIVPAVGRFVAAVARQGDCTLVVDQTGVGRALVDMLRDAPMLSRLVPVTITAGHTVTELENGSKHVPKKELVTCLQLLLQSRRLKIPTSLPEAGTLLKELANFHVKITAAANETFGAWRDGQHDDLVLAVALAAWMAERDTASSGECSCGGTNVAYTAPPGVFLEGDWRDHI
jgi:hypothetical protein